MNQTVKFSKLRASQWNGKYWRVEVNTKHRINSGSRYIAHRGGAVKL